MDTRLRRMWRRVTVAAVTGALLVGVAWAGAGLGPAAVTAGDVTGEVVRRAEGGAPDPSADRPPPGGPDRPGPPGRPGGPADPADPDPQPGDAVPAGTAIVRAGAGHSDLTPRPPEDATWEKDAAVCRLLDPSTVEQLGGALAALVAQEGNPWPVGPGCVYMGGYGIGPMFPMTDVDADHGLAARAVAFEGTDGGTLVVVTVDAIGWNWERVRSCPECGARAITQRLGDELGVDPAGIWIHATHSHTSPDAMGAWGGVPDWYLQQMTAGIEAAVRDAVTGLRPAVLEAVEVTARDHNRERRSTYRSAEEAHLAGLRALAVTDDGRHFLADDVRGTPALVGTLGAYAAHPTTRGSSGTTAHPDWPALFEAAVDDRDGGRTVHAHTGLGNLSTSGGTAMGTALADRLPRPGAGRLLTSADVRVERRVLAQPVSNVPLTLLGAPGFVDREFVLEPSTVSVGQSDTSPCVSAGPATVHAPIAAARIGTEVALTAGPGELFSNLTNTIKERSGAAVTLPLSQINDALGYIVQSFELDRPSQQGLGFAADGHLFVDYEDSYAIDACFGDAVLEGTLGLLDQLAAG